MTAPTIDEKGKLGGVRALLDEMLAETGAPLTDRERRDAERALGLAPVVEAKRAPRR